MFKEIVSTNHEMLLLKWYSYIYMGEDDQETISKSNFQVLFS